MKTSLAIALGYWVACVAAAAGQETSRSPADETQSPVPEIPRIEGVVEPFEAASVAHQNAGPDSTVKSVPPQTFTSSSTRQPTDDGPVVAVPPAAVQPLQPRSAGHINELRSQSPPPQDIARGKDSEGVGSRSAVHLLSSQPRSGAREVPAQWDDPPLPPPMPEPNAAADDPQLPAPRVAESAPLTTQSAEPARVFPPISQTPVTPPQPVVENTPMEPRPVAETETVRPVNYEQAVPNAVDLQAARNRMAVYRVDPNAEGLPGEPVSLQSLLTRTPVNNRLPLIKQYWRTAEDYSLWVHARHRRDRLARFSAPANPGDRALLEAVRALARDDVQEAEIRLNQSQTELRSLTNFNPAAPLPLPADPPLIQKFNTHYDYYSKREVLPSLLKRLDQILPQTLELVAQRGRTAQLANTAADQNQSAFGSGRAPIANALEACRVWDVAQRDLIRSVGNYNRATAQYAVNFRPVQPTQNLAAMLIANPDAVAQAVSSRTAAAPRSILAGSRAAPNPSPPVREPAAPAPGRNSNLGSSFGQPSGNLAPLGNPPTRGPTTLPPFGSRAGQDFGGGTGSATNSTPPSNSGNDPGGNSFLPPIPPAGQPPAGDQRPAGAPRTGGFGTSFGSN